MATAGCTFHDCRGPPPEEAEQWAERAYDLLPCIKLTDLFVEIDGWTKFTDCFTHLHSGNPAKSKGVLLAGTMADVTNQRTTKMTEACPGLSYEKLCWTAHSGGDVCESPR